MTDSELRHGPDWVRRVVANPGGGRRSEEAETENSCGDVRVHIFGLVAEGGEERSGLYESLRESGREDGPR